MSHITFAFLCLFVFCSSSSLNYINRGSTKSVNLFFIVYVAIMFFISFCNEGMFWFLRKLKLVLGLVVLFCFFELKLVHNLVDFGVQLSWVG